MISAYGHMVPLMVNYGQEQHSCREPMLGQSYSSQSRWEGKTEREEGKEDRGRKEKSIYAPRGPLSPFRPHLLINSSFS